MGISLRWRRPGRDSCLCFHTLCNPNTHFALCSAQAKIKCRQKLSQLLYFFFFCQWENAPPEVLIIEAAESMWLRWAVDPGRDMKKLLLFLFVITSCSSKAVTLRCDIEDPG